MRYRKADIVARALEVLDAYGLADLSMRRLGNELGVQASAIYHHFANKQTLLAALADEILERGRRERTATAWDEQVLEIGRELRDAMLAWQDGAELVATVRAFGLGASRPAEDLDQALAGSGLDEETRPVAVNTVLHFVFGDALAEQTQIQASSAGAIPDAPREGSDFELGLALVVDGIRAHARQSA
ncbi:TetR/AcrR family transcriptional regulator C-terminal domain-containing protein [Nocardioides sp. AE5]|uniref:TetR/AcrR family transcriptional regulator C-terminal domain-containing protein n=1 Tax=Nocardioides sp. AE5 TaxID=2962573 RepID=UPI0028816E97|nr:TetR/AcrR family transcriptional regulator C-terminal domain-containing protein [Nocardioides sp. AE5]MDT0202875.1 TetR/AcrR family transcriptional regulator C-terminal domain-containing protein [Nocardioides sp. AE5]